MEQLLTTGGGWQDQIGGFVPGLKIGRFVYLEGDTNGRISVECLPSDRHRSLIDELNRRLLFVYTGKTRLAKNLLQVSVFLTIAIGQILTKLGFFLLRKSFDVGIAGKMIQCQQCTGLYRMRRSVFAICRTVCMPLSLSTHLLLSLLDC